MAHGFVTKTRNAHLSHKRAGAGRPARGSVTGRGLTADPVTNATRVTNVPNGATARDASDERAAEFGRLVVRSAAGDRAAMEELLVRAQEVAFRFSVMVCGHAHDAEDVMQEALMKTYRHVGRIRNPHGFRTWLYTTVRNSCLMRRRRRVDEPAHLSSIDEGTATDGERSEALQVPDPGKRPDDKAINAWLGTRLRAAMKALPPAYRVIVFLREIEGLSTREVATVTGLSEANVKTRLLRARAMLREQLEAR
jgi:RNA polymerase sigma-70 factor (ECF subfamily)